MAPPASDHHRLSWAAALALALCLHAAVLWGLRHLPAPATHADAARLPPPAMTWQVRVAPPAPAPSPPPAPAPSPAPLARPPAPAARITPAPAAPRPRARPAPRPPTPAPEPVSVPDTPPAPPAPAEPPPPRPASSQPMQWLDANSADTAPAPEQGEWLLDPHTPWPDSYPSVTLRLWVSSRGRIERFELQGPAADDAAMQHIFARLAHTPMLPARIGRVPVPSTVRVQIWAPEGGQPPNYVMPLPSRP